MMFFYFITFFHFASATNYTPLVIQEMALERSSLIQVHELEKKALTQEMSYQGRWANPQVMGQFGSLRAGSMSGSTAEVSLTQAIPLSDKFSLKKVMGEAAVAAQQYQNQFYKNWVAHQALLSAWRVYIQQQLFNHVAERTRRLQLIKRYLDSRPHVTPKQKAELIIINSMLLQLERGQDDKNHELQVAVNDLEFWLGKKVLPSELIFSIPKKQMSSHTFIVSTEKDLEWVEARQKLKVSMLDAEIARKEKRPDIFLGGGYRVEDVSPANHFTYAIVGLNIPIWDSGTGRAEAANIRKMRDEKSLEETQKRLKLKHENQLEALKLAEKHLNRFSQGLIKHQEKAIDSAEEGFKRGQIDVNTFLQVETQTHETIDQVYLAWVGYLEQLSTLQLLRGEALQWENK
jgi:hypothetical protein